MPHDLHDEAPAPAALPPPEALADLGVRFEKACRAALRPRPDDDEPMARALATDLAETHRRAFDHALRLGQGFARTYGVELELSDLEAVVPALRSPCLRGALRAVPGEDAVTLERDGCPAAALGPGACDFHREAASGLVLGLAPGVRHTRYASRGHGDPSCVDLFFTDPESPLRFGPLPDELREPLAALAASARLVDPSAKVEFLGVSEGVLLYRVARSGCGGEVSVQRFVEHGLRRRFPELSVLEVSPRAPLGEP